MLQFNEKFLEENIITPLFKKLINVDRLEENEIEISLPLFFNNGDALDIILIKEKNCIVLKNQAYRLIEESLSDKISFFNFRKNYLFGSNEKILEISKTFLEENNIKNSLLQEKIIEFKNENNIQKEIESIQKEIICYSYYVIRFYNFIYDYFLMNQKEKIKKHFEKEIENFVNYYNAGKKQKLKKIENKKYNMISANNSYYSDNKIILTGINAKINFWEATRDIEKLTQELKLKNIVILYTSKGKNDLTNEYMVKVLADYKNEDMKFEMRDIGKENNDI